MQAPEFQQEANEQSRLINYLLSLCQLHCAIFYIDAPVITCDDVTANVGDFNVKIQCRIKAKPEVTSLYWAVDYNDTSLASIDSGLIASDRQWTTVVRVSLCCSMLRSCSQSALSIVSNSCTAECR